MKFIVAWAVLCFACSVAGAQSRLYVSGSSAPFPLQSETGWYKLTAFLPVQTGTPGLRNIDGLGEVTMFAGNRPVAFASVGVINTTAVAGHKYIASLFFRGGLSGHSQLVAGQDLDYGFREGNVFLISWSPGLVYPSNHPQASSSGWILKPSGGVTSTYYAEHLPRRSATSMTFVRTSQTSTPVLADNAPWFVLEPTTNPLAASGGGADAWTTADVANLLDYTFDLKRDFQRFFYSYDEEPDIYNFQELGTDMTVIQESVSSLDGKMDSLISSVDAILMELINPSSYYPTKAGVYGTGSTPTAFSTFGSSVAKPGIDSARGTLGEFNDPFQGAPVSIPGGSAIDSPTVSATGMSFSVDMRELGGGFLPAGVDSTVLPGVQTLAVSFGPVQPFIDICRWLMIGLVTLFSAERVFSEFRRL